MIEFLDELVFPEPLSKGSSCEIDWRVSVAELASGREERNAATAHPLRRFDARWAIRDRTEIEAVLNLHHVAGGTLRGFRFRDYTDDRSALGSGPITAEDQRIGTGDGTTLSFDLVKTYRVGAHHYIRPILKPVPGSVLVAIDGEIVAADVDHATGRVTFAAPPAAGTEITAGFLFHVPVRFDQALDIDAHGEFDDIPAVPLVELRLPGDDAEAPFGWDDVFADHRALGGEDWRGWGTDEDRPAEVPLEFFLREVLPGLQAEDAVVRLRSPTGAMHLRGRMQPPPRSVLRRLTLDLGDTVIERGRTGVFWGQFHLWGDLVEDPASALAQVGADADEGDTELVIAEGANGDAFLAAVGPGKIAQVRTNKTAPNYHPPESRTTIFVTSVSGRTLTLARPLEIDVPMQNPPLPGDDDDPSTVTLLLGALLSADVAAGATSITLADTTGLEPGDWLWLSTAETPYPDGNQFAATLGALLDPTQPFGTIPINEEINRITAKAGNTLTLAYPLGKNKLTAWNAAAVKVDPIDGLTLQGGRFEGFDPHDGADPWEHQYVWARYCIDSIVRDYRADMGDRPLSVRRMGQAVRLDTGFGNRVFGGEVGRAGGIEAGEGYGVSLRRGERFTVVAAERYDRARHSVELWSTSGGCVVERNEADNDTSSSLDTHGSWNTDVTIRRNLVTNDGALLSSDLGGLPDAIRIGNNRFWFDEEVQILENRVAAYRGAAVSVVPGSRKVTVDGLDCDDVDRVLKLTRNPRHPDLFSEDILLRNVTADDVRDRICEVGNSAGGLICRRLTLRDWTIGGTGLGTAPLSGILNLRIFGVEDLVLERVRLEAIATQANHFAWDIRHCDGVHLDDCLQQGGERGLRLEDVTGLSGEITLRDLTANTAIVLRELGTCSGAITIRYSGFAPVVETTNIAVTLVPE